MQKHGVKRHRKSWSELTPRQKTAAIAVSVVEIVMTILMQRDLHRRAADQVRGPVGLWRMLAFVQSVGPVAYFLLGRRRGAAT